MKKLLGVFLFFAFVAVVCGQNPLPHVVSGKIERIENFQSKYITPRNIDVWLPENYSYGPQVSRVVHERRTNAFRCRIHMEQTGLECR